MPYLSMAYDSLGLLLQSWHSLHGTESYAYSPAARQRIWRKLANGEQELYLNGPGGERLMSLRYICEASGYNCTELERKNWLYFGGRAIREQGEIYQWNTPPHGKALVLDRLGSVRVAASLSDSAVSTFYPYGEEYQPTANDRDKFATYRRDSNTGLDYAMHRYYASAIGRFTTPDPYRASAGPAEPQSWNRYS
jgi:RHS repeat-associated protein